MNIPYCTVILRLPILFYYKNYDEKIVHTKEVYSRATFVHTIKNVQQATFQKQGKEVLREAFRGIGYSTLRLL